MKKIGLYLISGLSFVFFDARICFLEQLPLKS